MTPRNIFITVLAISDILLCTFVMPLTAVDVLRNFWPFGPNMTVLCKLIGTIQATCVFFASFSILLVALDRYQFVVNFSRPQASNRMAWISSLSMFLLSGVFSSPLFIVTKLKFQKNIFNGKKMSYCYEVCNYSLLKCIMSSCFRIGENLTTDCHTPSFASSFNFFFLVSLCASHILSKLI